MTVATKWCQTLIGGERQGLQLAAYRNLTLELRIGRLALSTWWDTGRRAIPRVVLLAYTRYQYGHGLNVWRWHLSCAWYPAGTPWHEPGTLRLTNATGGDKS